MKNNKILPLVPVSVKAFLFSFYDGEPNAFESGLFITNLIRDYLRNPDKYSVKPSAISRLLRDENLTILTISLNEKDYSLFCGFSEKEMRSITKQGAWVLLSIAASLKQLKIKQITFQNNRLTFN